MERLTKREYGEVHHVTCGYSCDGCSGSCAPATQAMKRLAAYEDTGLEPEEIMDMLAREDSQPSSEKIKREIAYYEMEIDDLQRRLDKEVEQFKAYIAEGDAYRIAVASRDSKYQDIQSDVKRLVDLRDMKRWLLHMLTK